jgi:hypothetical protein
METQARRCQVVHLGELRFQKYARREHVKLQQGESVFNSATADVFAATVTSGMVRRPLAH